MKDFTYRIGILIGPLFIIGLLVYFLFNTRNIDNEDEVIILSKQEIIDKEFEKLYQNENVYKDLRNTFIDNKNNIVKGNCSGLLESASSKIKSKGLITKDITIKLDDNTSNLIIYYNACNLNYSKGEQVVFAISTTKLVDYLKEDDYGNQFVQGLNIEITNKKFKNNKSYIPLDLLLI